MQAIKRILLLSLITLMTFLFTFDANAKVWSVNETYTIHRDRLSVHRNPSNASAVLFDLYKNMEITPTAIAIIDNEKWFKISEKDFWIKAISKDRDFNVYMNTSGPANQIRDLYGILDEPHNYAVKLTKFSDATGRLETFKKADGQYRYQESYSVHYPKAGPKDKYGDLKTVGGPVIRYLYRTTRSGMTGWDQQKRHFGVYKVSYPMPHDGLPFLLSGRMTLGQYLKLPALNFYMRDQKKVYYPHPHSILGADIVLHTERKGSRGCIVTDNERMSHLYFNDLVTENDHEIIPFIIYDEDQTAPQEGILF